jgi:thioredoxin reductase (NADPH)
MNEGASERGPVLMAVDAVPRTAERIEAELTKRYGEDYEIACPDTPEHAMDILERFKHDGRQVAVILAAAFLPGLDGTDFLARAHHLFPTAKRGLLIDWGDTSTFAPVRRAMALGHIDFFVQKPLGAREENFHRAISELLQEWAYSQGLGVEAVRIVGERWSQRSQEMRSLLERYGIPFTSFVADAPEGRRLLAEVGASGQSLPVLLLFDGRVLVDPEYFEVADAFGASVEIGGEREDLTIVGAGPAGLAAAVYGASEGMDTLVLDHEAIGGQAGTSSRIRNYLGFPRGVGGGELAQRAYLQAWLLGARFNFLRSVTALRPEGDRFVLDVAGVGSVTSRAVVLALGVRYTRLGVDSLESLVGAGVFYGASGSEARAMAGEDVCVVGGANSAGQAALHLARYASTVTLVVRGDSLDKSMSQYLIEEIGATGTIVVRLGTRVVGGGGQGRLDHIILEAADGAQESLTTSAVFVLIGAHPHTDWLPAAIARDEHGFVLVGADAAASGSWPLERPPLQLETSMPGVFAVGDVRRGSVKRVASAVGDGAVVVQLVHQFLGAS